MSTSGGNPIGTHILHVGNVIRILVNSSILLVIMLCLSDGKPRGQLPPEQILPQKFDRSSSARFSQLANPRHIQPRKGSLLSGYLYSIAPNSKHVGVHAQLV